MRARHLGRVMLRSHTTDIAVFGELANGAYEALPDLDARSIVDLGANTGLAARWLHDRYPHARLVCVEPEHGNATMLRENTRDLDATIVEACVGAHERFVSLETETGEFGYHATDQPGDVPVITMQQVLDRAHMSAGELDVVKCDIEGGEAELLADCADWIRRVRALVVECHQPYTAERLRDDLERNGGSFRALHIERDPAYGVQTVTLLNE